ncbi:MAG TPA: TonB-dependent receptor [Gemmatimonadota bacterium]|nr:TonB-dependent receptor [Gemmatimonadota bacterium]
MPIFHGPPARPSGALWLASALALLLTAAPLAAQDPAPRAVTGTVVDARTGEPIEGAVVVLEPLPGGVLGPDRASGAIRAWRSATTAGGGRYTFGGLPAGAYRLRVSRYAYEPATVEIDVRRGSAASISVGLVVDPVAMEPVEVILAGATAPAIRNAFAGERDQRAALEHERQARWLPSDVRAVTRNDVVDGVTLGESDLFRALQRIPGVTTRDDYTAELWTRGAPWSHTRVTYDGLPLFNPLHGVGVFSGVNPDAVGAAFFFPGARPAAIGEGAAAVVELASRPPRAESDLAGLAEISLVSARAALDRGGARGGWVLSGRRSWLDLVTWAIEAASDGEDIHVPYAFTDISARGDLALGGGRVFEASGLWITDDVRDSVPDVAEAGPSRWGNALARATLEAPVAGLTARTTIGATRFTAEGLRDPFGSVPSLFDPSGIRTDHEVLHWTVATAIAPTSARDARWAAGAAIIGERQRYRGPEPSAHPGRTTLDSLSTDQELTRLALWADRRLSTRSLAIDLGARVELGGDIADESPLRLAPRAAVRWSMPGGRATVSLAWTRAWQSAQTLAPAGLSVGPRLHPNEVWFLPDDSIPALESDIATLGGEAWLGEAWLVSATGWIRRTDGTLLLDPRPGPIVDRETFVAGENRAHGLELSLRRLFGRWTTSLGYAWTRSESEAMGLTFPASSERRHAVDAVASVRLGESWRAGAAWRWTSGAPFTRFFSAVFSCQGAQPCTIAEPAVVEDPNAERGPTWSTLDLLAEWTRDRGSWALSVYGQLSNALNRDNALTYMGTVRCADAGLPCQTIEDEFERGLPILPVVGVRMAF